MLVISIWMRVIFFSTDGFQCIENILARTSNFIVCYANLLDVKCPPQVQALGLLLQYTSLSGVNRVEQATVLM